jgi:hypothetical protein
MLDAVLGIDRRLLAQFVQCCRFAAVAHFYERIDHRHENMVWPLYSSAACKARPAISGALPGSLEMIDMALGGQGFESLRAHHLTRGA